MKTINKVALFCFNISSFSVFQSDFILIWRRARSNLLSALLSNFSAFCGALQRDIIVMANQPVWRCTGLQERTIEPYFNVRASADRNEVFRCRRHLQSRGAHPDISPHTHVTRPCGTWCQGRPSQYYNKHIFLRKERASWHKGLSKVSKYYVILKALYTHWSKMS